MPSPILESCPRQKSIANDFPLMSLILIDRKTGSVGKAPDAQGTPEWGVDPGVGRANF